MQLWQLFYVIATVISIAAFLLKVKVFLKQLRARRDELSSLDEADETQRAQRLKKHTQRLVETARTINMIYASMMVGIAESVPLGILG